MSTGTKIVAAAIAAVLTAIAAAAFAACGALIVQLAVNWYGTKAFGLPPITLLEAFFVCWAVRLLFSKGS